MPDTVCAETRKKDLGSCPSACVCFCPSAHLCRTGLDIICVQIVCVQIVCVHSIGLFVFQIVCVQIVYLWVWIASDGLIIFGSKIGSDFVRPSTQLGRTGLQQHGLIP